MHTVLTSKKTKGRKGRIIAIIKGTKSDKVIEDLLKINGKLRLNVREITLDMAGSMKLRISHRWEAIEQENYLLTQAKEKKKNPEIEIFKNGDTRKQLLARSRYLLYKSREKWTASQNKRAEILFSQYPDLEKAYNLSDGLRKIYNQNIQKSVAMLKLAHWFKEVEESGFKSFSVLRKTIMNHYNDILNYFDARSTNGMLPPNCKAIVNSNKNNKKE